MGEWVNNLKDGMVIYIFNKCNNNFSNSNSNNSMTPTTPKYSQFSPMKQKYLSLSYYFGPIGNSILQRDKDNDLKVFFIINCYILSLLLLFFYVVAVIDFC
jgi:hypothetical protein